MTMTHDTRKAALDALGRLSKRAYDNNNAAWQKVLSDEQTIRSALEAPSGPPVPDEFRDLSNLVAELCDSIEANQADVGTEARSVGELLQLIGPAVTKTEDMLAAAPEPGDDGG